jgi:hypothetical protein
MNARSAALVVFALASSAMVALAAAPDGDAVLGVWHGTSLCTDREVAPACKDEQVRYTFTRLEGPAPGRYHLAADKLVNGEYARMGDLDFAFDPAQATWTSEFQNARFHGVWSLRLGSDGLEGTLVDVPTGKVVRRIAVRRD